MDKCNYIEYNTNYRDDLICFFNKNDYLFIDSFSNHVSLDDYIDKLSNNGKIIMALFDNNIVGFIGGYMNDFNEFNSYIQILLVDKCFQQKGIATNLIKQFIIMAVDSKMKNVFLTVDESNKKAQQLYGKLGFKFFNDIKDKRKMKLHMVKTIYDSNNIISTSEVQKILLKMAKEITKILDDNNIKYFLAFGSLLGAVRHKGFIPWDDDFDLFLFDESYENALKVLAEFLPKDLFLEHEKTEKKYFHSWAHIKDINTVCECSQYPQDGIYLHKGISIDLYRLFPMKMCDVEQFRLNENKKYLDRLLNVGLISKDKYETKCEDIRSNLEKIKTTNSSEEVYAMVLNEEYVFKKDIFPLKKYFFEDTYFWGPNIYDSMLNHFYNNSYMELPRIENRVPHYDCVYKIF